MTYTWGEGKRYSVDAEVVGATVDRIAEENGGVCPPGVLVTESESPDSPTHKLFTWKDSAAAANWRRHQARLAINSLRITYDDTKPDAPAFVSVSVIHDEGVSRGYRATLRVVTEEDLYVQALEEARAALNGLRRRYAHLKELKDVWEAVATA